MHEIQPHIRGALHKAENQKKIKRNSKENQKAENQLRVCSMGLINTHLKALVNIIYIYAVPSYGMHDAHCVCRS